MYSILAIGLAVGRRTGASTCTATGRIALFLSEAARLCGVVVVVSRVVAVSRVAVSRVVVAVSRVAVSRVVVVVLLRVLVLVLVLLQV